MNNFIYPLTKGFFTGAPLIIAIGAQNAFVLKQGILKNHVFITVIICAFIDTILIIVGVGGIGQILISNSILLLISRWGGAIFLLYYGILSFSAVMSNHSLKINKRTDNLPGRKETIVTVLALSLLNPHVYLDTIILLGSVGAQLSPLGERICFALGAALASFVWFFTIGFGARYLEPLFQKPISWRALDFVVGIMMWIVAINLIFE